jgi:biotin synthase
MTEAEILQAADTAAQLGYGTVVMQSGEDYGITAEWLADVIRNIKRSTPLAVTLSMGERPHEDLVLWREAGADRYLLRFETSERTLYDAVHPPLAGCPSDRLAILRDLHALGYEIGGGVMVGLAGQSYASLARDVDLFRQMDMDMVGIGPYIPNPDTPLGRGEVRLPSVRPDDQVPNTEEMTYKIVALTRLVCPEANIPSTTALSTVNKAMGRELGLRRGANVFMPNVTPAHYRDLYRIYPNKASLHETALPCEHWLAEHLEPIGRRVGRGPGGRRRASQT